MKISCPHCDQHIEAPDEYVGKQVQCPTCEQEFVVEVSNNPPPVPDAQDNPEQSNPSFIVFERPKSFVGGAIKWLILIDDQPFGTIANDSKAAVLLPPGEHDINAVMGDVVQPTKVNVPAGAGLSVTLAMPQGKGPKVAVRETRDMTSSEFEGLNLSPLKEPQKLPSQWGLVFACGLIAWIIGIVGFIALGQGLRSLKMMKLGYMESNGKGLVFFGTISGVLGFIANATVIILRFRGVI